MRVGAQNSVIKQKKTAPIRGGLGNSFSTFSVPLLFAAFA
jgi:hypothetical protein